MKSSRISRALALFSAVAACGGTALGLNAIGASAAASCVVNSNLDNPRAASNTCDSTAGAGVVTLRSAIQHTNANAGGTITFSSSLANPTKITLATELSVTAGPTTISGPGARGLVIDGNNTTRIFHVSNGAVANISGVTLRHANITSGYGAALWDQSVGTVTVDGVAFLSNHANFVTAGAYLGTSIGGHLIVRNSLFNANTAGYDAALAQDGGLIDATNVTFTGNISTIGDASVGGAFAGGTMNLNFVTVAGNSGPPAALANSGTHIKNSIVANNTPANCKAVTDDGYNLSFGDASCGFTAPKNDQVGVDPQLAALANNGGPTDTMRLQGGSPAIDNASPTCPPPAADQRGVTRPSGAKCDIGAYERCVPTVSSVQPATGPSAGGTKVTITGTCLGVATTARFGSVGAATFSATSATSATATSPKGTGTVDVTVTNPDGTSAVSAADTFTYGPAPTASPSPSVTPALPKAGSPVSPGPGGGWALLLLAVVLGSGVLLTSRSRA